MKIELTPRAKECTQKIEEQNEELKDYNAIIMCIRALQAVEAQPDKFKYSKDDYDKVVAKLRNLCAKHEIKLPDGDYIEWGVIEIV